MTKTKPHCFRPGRSSCISHKAAKFSGQSSVERLLFSTRTPQELRDFLLLICYLLESCGLVIWWKLVQSGCTLFSWKAGEEIWKMEARDLEVAHHFQSLSFGKTVPWLTQLQRRLGNLLLCSWWHQGKQLLWIKGKMDCGIQLTFVLQVKLVPKYTINIIFLFILKFQDQTQFFTSFPDYHSCWQNIYFPRTFILHLFHTVLFCLCKAFWSLHK